MVALSKPQNYTLTVGIANMQGEFMTDWGIIFSGAALSALPMIIFFLLFQRYFLEGVGWAPSKRLVIPPGFDIPRRSRGSNPGQVKSFIMTNPLNVAVIGAGLLGSRHAHVFHER